MAKTANDIVDRALTLVDEVVTTFNTAATTETSLREIALEILPEVCRDLVKELPYELKRYLAVPGTLIVDTLTGGEDQSPFTKQKVAFEAPADFWELVAIKLTSWAKPVTEYIHIGSPTYSKQNNPFSRAGKYNPVVAVSNASTGSNMRIECFSIIDGDPTTTTVFEYVAFGNVPDNAGTEWPDEIFDEITKALATELNIIKGRLEAAEVKGVEITNALEQHE